MPHRSPPPLWNNFALDPAASVSRQLQIVAFLRKAILDGRARGGSRLPPSRVLAVDLGVSRQTIVLAYEALTAEGLAKSRRGSGIYISDGLPERVAHPSKPTAHSDVPPRRPTPALSKRGQMLAGLALTPAGEDPGFWRRAYRPWTYFLMRIGPGCRPGFGVAVPASAGWATRIQQACSCYGRQLRNT